MNVSWTLSSSFRQWLVCTAQVNCSYLLNWTTSHCRVRDSQIERQRDMSMLMRMAMGATHTCNYYTSAMPLNKANRLFCNQQNSRYAHDEQRALQAELSKFILN